MVVPFILYTEPSSSGARLPTTSSSLVEWSRPLAFRSLKQWWSWARVVRGLYYRSSSTTLYSLSSSIEHYPSPQAGFIATWQVRMDAFSMRPFSCHQELWAWKKQECQNSNCLAELAFQSENWTVWDTHGRAELAFQMMAVGFAPHHCARSI